MTAETSSVRLAMMALPDGPPALERPWPLRERVKRGARAAAGTLLPASLIVWRGPRSAPGKVATRTRVALTFDDGPTALTREYLAVLERFGARATFFVVGELCARHPELVLAIAKEGHELAGHGYTHRRFRDLSRRELGYELTMTRRLLPGDGRKRAFVRPPHGAVSLSSTLTTASAGFTTALWSYDSGDWATENAADVVARFYEHPVESGDVVLLHEGQTWTLDALPKIVETLQRAGHELVTMGELLGR
jgi:peptidoglycan/xylan/chitin deacetylase (PgdA/CDA1 family)